VGINTTTPTSIFTVSGNSTLNGTLAASGTTSLNNITITPTSSTKTTIDSIASGSSIDFTINGTQYLGINDTAGVVTMNQNLKNFRYYYVKRITNCN
jgi:subtilase family serine protease